MPDPEHVHLQLIGILHGRVWARKTNNGANNKVSCIPSLRLLDHEMRIHSINI